MTNSADQACHAKRTGAGRSFGCGWSLAHSGQMRSTLSSASPTGYMMAATGLIGERQLKEPDAIRVFEHLRAGGGRRNLHGGAGDGTHLPGPEIVVVLVRLLRCVL